MYNTEFNEQNYNLFNNNKVLLHRNILHLNKIDENLALNNEIPDVNVVPSFPNYFSYNNDTSIELANRKTKRRRIKRKKKDR